MIANSGKERRTSLSGEMVEEEMEKGWGSLARGGRKASLPVLTSYKKLSTIDTLDVSTDKVDIGTDKVNISIDKVDTSRLEGGSSRESSSSRTRTRDTSALIIRERRSTPAR